jgi:CubicO group peptidase (beta-lactamase class C family)
MTETARWGGTVVAGYERLRDAFVDGLDDFGAGGGALAAYVDGQPVVNLWGGLARPGQAWERDTLTVVFSTTKALATLCAQILFDRGQLDLDARVADVWPEFSAAGKERVRVRHVLSHTSGVLAPVNVAEFLFWKGTGWDQYDEIAAGLAAAKPAITVGATFAYQAVSFGWMVGELVRRISGQSVGTFFRREVAEPLGLDIWIGTPRSIQPRVARFLAEPPRALDADAAALVARARSISHDPTTLTGKAFLALSDGDFLDNVSVVNRPEILDAEIPGFNGTAAARSLARLFAALTEGGQLDGVRLVSAASIRQFRKIQICAPHALELEPDPPPATVELHMRMLGYHGSSKPFGLPRRLGPSDTAFGHDGAGGQLAFADPEAGIAAAFVRSQFTSTSTYSGHLLELLYSCAGRN